MGSLLLFKPHYQIFTTSEDVCRKKWYIQMYKSPFKHPNQLPFITIYCHLLPQAAQSRHLSNIDHLRHIAGGPSRQSSAASDAQFGTEDGGGEDGARATGGETGGASFPLGVARNVNRKPWIVAILELGFLSMSHISLEHPWGST